MIAFNWFRFFLDATRPEARVPAVGAALGEGYRDLTNGLIFLAVQEGRIPWNDKMPKSWQPSNQKEA